jgi:pseudouridine-5'-phosphate glycosidase
MYRALERLETFAVPVLGYGTNKFPGFYLTESGYEIEHRVDSVAEIAAIWSNRFELETDNRAIVIANPVVNQMDLALHNEILDSGLKAADTDQVTGKAVTPFLLEYFHTHSKGESLRVNIEIIKANSHLAALIAIALNKVSATH